MKIFVDSEFTGLHPGMTLISLGMVTEDDQSFYAEFNDYDRKQIDPWIQKHIINQLYTTKNDIENQEGFYTSISEPIADTMIIGNTKEINHELFKWLHQFDQVEWWSDVYDAYDKYLFDGLFGGADGIPKNIYYIPFDLATYMKVLGVDPDVNREQFAGIKESDEIQKHLSIWDAKVIKKCYEKLSQMQNKKQMQTAAYFDGKSGSIY